jgi:hypothetical protein
MSGMEEIFKFNMLAEMDEKRYVSAVFKNGVKER